MAGEEIGTLGRGNHAPNDHAPIAADADDHREATSVAVAESGCRPAAPTRPTERPRQDDGRCADRGPARGRRAQFRDVLFEDRHAAPPLDAFGDHGRRHRGKVPQQLPDRGLIESTTEGRRERCYESGAALLISVLTVLRATPIGLAIVLMPSPFPKCRRGISAQSSTESTSPLPERQARLRSGSSRNHSPSWIPSEGDQSST